MAGQTKLTPDELNALVQRLRAEYANDPNILQISWGMPRRAGAVKTEAAIIFRVRQKVSEHALGALGTRLIPAQIDGVPTDVQVRNSRPSETILSSRDELADPLQGGWLTATYNGHAFWFASGGGGSLGVLCTDNATGDTMALSNWHVWADGFEEGDNILQPSTPSGGQYVEGTVKVLACGPLLTSLIEWDVPDPLTAGLYGGAAAATVAAMLSDHRDPTRRGQDATPTAPGEVTLDETVISAADHVDLPFPGLPFRSKVKWNYQRRTDRQEHTHEVAELMANPQFLLGKYVRSDQHAYQAGSVVTINAAIWDYQPRPCDAYLVVANVIPERQPQQVHRVVLHPSSCDRVLPGNDVEQACIDFGHHRIGQTFGHQHVFDWLQVRTADNQPLLIVDWHRDEAVTRGELRIPQRGLVCWHAPARRVFADVMEAGHSPVTLRAYDIAGNLLAEQTSAANGGRPVRLTANGAMIARTVLSGGANEASLLRYCTVPSDHSQKEFEIPGRLVGPLGNAHVPTLDGCIERHVRAKRCCFSGRLRLPASIEPGRCHVYVFVQNINHVPDGTPPEQAATVIGGHVLSAGVPSVLVCAGMLLGDHVFDIF
jgi:hypothetical protein